MDKISKPVQLPIHIEEAFEKFVNQLNAWWPREYTWSGQQLVDIRIDPRQDGLCTETGPYHFRCDWGRVLEIKLGSKIRMKWQISPQRVPEPDPARASEVTVYFREDPDAGTIIELEHAYFENHGDGALEYLQAMDSKHGWDYILEKYVKYCTQ